MTIPPPRCAYVLTVHAGAGTHSPANDRALRQSLRACLDHVERTHGWDASADELVVTATAFLEDLPMTNAGTGCTLTEAGAAECDAILVTTDAAGAVGAITGVRNPVRVAAALHSQHGQPSGPLGLHPPSILTGGGAKGFAAAHGIPTGYDARTPRTGELFEQYAARVDAAETCVSDTVGAAAVDVRGHAAAAASSGGGWLRPAGRVGAAGVPGAGAAVDGECAALASGHGERIVAQSLALRTAMGAGDVEVGGGPEVGVLRLKAIDERSAVVEFAHSTSAFALAWAAPAEGRRKALVSRGEGSACGGARLRRVTGD